MALSHGLADLLLVVLGELVPAVEKAVVLLLGIAIHFLQGVHNVFNHLGGGAAPEKSQNLRSPMRGMAWLQLLPVAPHPGLELLTVDPGAEAEFTLLDLDLVVLAFFIGATSAVAGRYF